LKSAFNADRQMLMEKIDDLEAKLTNRHREIQSQQQKIHMLTQGESALKNELNFWNGKVTTLRRDSESLQTFAETMQAENRKLQADAESLRQELDTKDKNLQLTRRELGGLADDNDRLRRMYELVQKEAFNGVEKLKAGAPDSSGEQKVKKGYQPLRNDPPMPVTYGANPQNKKTQNMWQIVDDGFGSSRDLSNITAVNGMSDITSKDQQMTIKQHQ
jgi:regulator of replication initiation timing